MFQGPAPCIGTVMMNGRPLQVASCPWFPSRCPSGEVGGTGNCPRTYLCNKYHILQGIAGPAGCWPHTNDGGVCATAATSTCAFTATSTRTRTHAPRHASNTRRGGNTHAHLRFQFGKWRIAHLRSWPGRLPTCLFKWAMPGNSATQKKKPA